MNKRTRIEMAQPTDKAQTGGNQVPLHVTMKPAVTLAELKADTEYDPDGAEEFVALIRALRKDLRP